MDGVMPSLEDMADAPFVTESPMSRQFLSAVDGGIGTPRAQHAPTLQQSSSANDAGLHSACATVGSVGTGKTTAVRTW